MTRDQWVSTRGAVFTGDVVKLAEALFRGEDCLFALRDALLEAGHEALAAHFANPAQTHVGSRPGPGQCRALLLILGRLSRRRELLRTPTASEWLGLTPPQFRRLASGLKLEPEGSYRNEHYRSG